MEKIQKELDGKFTSKKLKNIPIICSYERLGRDKKAERMGNCGNFTEFKKETGKLHKANFCKDRLCNMCAWRRSLKIFGQVSKIMDELEKNYSFIFLTLTVRNCSADALPATVDILQKGFKAMDQSTGAKAFKGYFKALEITHHYDYVPSLMYHPHLHAIVAVNKSYFTSRDYVSLNKLISIWRKACNLDYDPSVDIKKVKPQPDEKDEYSIKKAVCEAAKYTVKPEQISHGTYSEIDRTVQAYVRALTNRRMCSFGGAFKDVAQKLKLDDMVDGDLVNTDNEEVRSDIAYTIVQFGWKIGIGYSYIGEYTITPKETKENEYQTADG